MPDREILIEYLDQVLDACSRIARRFEGIKSPSDFQASDVGLDKLDGICMMLIAIGENLKKIDQKTSRTLLRRYPAIPWDRVKGARDVITHGYFDVDVDVVFDICKNRLAELVEVVKRIREDIADGSPS